MATRDDSVLAWLRGELAADWKGYRDGDTGWQTVRAMLETVFAVALLFRVTTHVLAYSALADADHPLDVDYGLTLHTHVCAAREAPLSAVLQLGLASTVLACLLSLRAMRMSFDGVIAAFAVANWLVLFLDPLWLALAAYRA